MTEQRQIRFWLGGFLAFLVFIWLLSDILLPFIAGIAIAYLLDPATDRLQRWGAPRWLAATLVLLGFALLLVLALLLLAPLIQAQIAQILDTLPRIVDWVRDTVVPAINRLATRFSDEDVARLRSAAEEYAGSAVGWLVGVMRNIVSSGLALFDVLSVLLITPIVAFYLLRDWDPLMATLESWLPRQHRATILEQARQVDETLAGFVRGQASVCLALGVFYAIALTVIGLEFGLVVGLIAGFLSFVPYVGSLVGFGLSVSIALAQYDSWTMVGVVVGIFLFGQAVEGNVLTPKLVGERVGLHPVWVIFALMAGGSLFGFVGVLLAVPVAAVIGVLTRFLLRQYLDSRYYTGPEMAAVDPRAQGGERP